MSRELFRSQEHVFINHISYQTLYFGADVNFLQPFLDAYHNCHLIIFFKQLQSLIYQSSYHISCFKGFEFVAWNCGTLLKC